MLTNDETPTGSANLSNLLGGDAEALLDSLMRYLPVGLTIARNPDVEILRVSDAGAQLLQRSRNHLEHITVETHADAYRVSHPQTGELADPACLPLTRATLNGEVVQGEEWLITAEDGRKVPILCNAGPLRNAAGKVIGGIIAWADLTKQKQLEAELKAAVEMGNALMRELHHRVKNHLYIVSSIIRTESKDSGEEAQALAARLSQRLHALGESYGALEATKIGGVSAARLVEHVCRPLATDRIKLEVDTDDLEISASAIPILGIILNEGVCNALKHAFPDDRRGTVSVSLTRAEEGYRLKVSDDGEGLSTGMTRTGGTELVRHLAGVLQGKSELRPNEGRGATMEVVFSRI